MHLHMHLQCRPDLTRPDLTQILSSVFQVDSWTASSPASTTDRVHESPNQSAFENRSGNR